MAKTSAGVLLFRRRAHDFDCLLGHPGGPFWARKDLGAWTMPKGEYAADEDPEAAARREFTEETGHVLAGDLLPLGEARQRGGKLVVAFACEGDFACAALVSNRFELEWPPRSGRMILVPELDRAEWFAADVARLKILDGQRVFIDRLAALLAADASSPAEL